MSYLIQTKELCFARFFEARVNKAYALRHFGQAHFKRFYRLYSSLVMMYSKSSSHTVSCFNLVSIFLSLPRNEVAAACKNTLLANDVTLVNFSKDRTPLQSPCPVKVIYIYIYINKTFS